MSKKLPIDNIVRGWTRRCPVVQNIATRWNEDGQRMFWKCPKDGQR